MYISEFVCGIGATLLFELVALIIYAIYGNERRKEK